MFTIIVQCFENGKFSVEITKPSGNIDNVEYTKSELKDYMKAVKDYCRKGYGYHFTNLSGYEELTDWVRKLASKKKNAFIH